MTIKTPITVAYGDGIGPEIMDATLRIITEAGARIDIEKIEIGEAVYKRGLDSGIEPASWESLRRTQVFLKAPITTPQGGGFKSLNVTVRKTLGMYANVRPCASLHPFVSTKHPKMNIVIVRENEEDVYGGIEHRQTNQASWRHRRGSLEHVMPTVKEIDRVALVGRHRRETRKGCERGRRPLPSVPEQPLDPPSAGAGRLCVHGFGVEACEIEIAVRTFGRRFAPRIASRLTVRSSIGRTMVLRLRRKECALPTRVRLRLLQRDVDRPRKRERNPLEATAEVPRAIRSLPKKRRWAALGDESEPFRIGHVESIDRECLDRTFELSSFVIPRKSSVVGRSAEDGDPARNAYGFASRGRLVVMLRAHRMLLPIRELMDDVHQRLMMHRFVFEDRMDGERIALLHFIEHAEDAFVAGRDETFDTLARRPAVDGDGACGSAALGIDAAAKELLEFRVDRFLAAMISIER